MTGVAVCNFASFMRHFNVQIHRNVNNNGLALIFVAWMCETGVVLDLDEQTVRFQLLLSVQLTLLEAVVGVRCSMGQYVILFDSCAILLPEYTATLIITDSHWSSLVERMKRVPCWPWTNRLYVCSHYCVHGWPYSKLSFVLEYGAVCNVMSFMHAMHYFAVRIHRNVNNNGLALIFVGWMYGTGAVLTLDEQAVRL